MKITPLEIRQHEFEKTFRGYNIEEVDNFLANLSQEWERILNESKMLRMQLEMAEKEASKLREIEMTLFKTLKTAEDTSSMITDQANQQADKNIQEAKLKSQEIVRDAQAEADKILQDAQNRARYIKEEVLGEVKLLEKDFKTMYQYKTDLLVQMRSLSTATLEHVQRFEEKFNKENVAEKIKEAFDIFTENGAGIPVLEENKKVVQTETIEYKEEVKVMETIVVSEAKYFVEEAALPFTNNEAKEKQPEQAVVETETTEDSEDDKSDELGIIEGIGPKIAMLLYDSGIFTFKDLASTPVQKIRELLDNAGPTYAMHDPSTWVEQAVLAAEGRFDELEEMKGILIGGRAEEDVEEKGIDNTTSYVEAAAEEEKEIAQPEAISHEAQKSEEPVAPVNNLDSITEEMLEKVNKVKEAVRKAMVEKEEKPLKDTSPLPKLNDITSKNTENSGSSFFDNI